VNAYEIAQNEPKDKSSKEGWIPVGYNSNRVATLWVRVKTYETLNENSFRLQAQHNDNGKFYEGKLDINCKNKDFYWRRNGVFAQAAPWAVIPQGSGLESVAMIFCKRSAAAAAWGYTKDNAYLWDILRPNTRPENAKGNWIKHYDGDDAEGYYNDEIINIKGDKLFAMWVRTKKGERSAASPKDTTSYYWIAASCTENSGSTFVQLDSSVEGEWLAPVPGRPGGALLTVKQMYCKP